MLAADSGGGLSGGTDWNATDVKYMWSAVENHDTDAYFNVVINGWQATADLISAHISRVSTYRDNLASAWSPKKSEASAAYIGRLNQLIAHLNETLTATSANITAFRTVASDLAVAQIKLKPILEQYEANEKANLDWQSAKNAADKTAAPAPTASPTPSPSPSPPPVPSTPPVSSAHQEQLNNQARVIMFDLSSSVLSGQAGLKAPKPYQPNDEGLVGGGEGEGKRTDGSNFTATPFITPSGGVAVDSSRPGGSTSPPSHVGAPVPSSTTVPVHQSPIGTSPGPTPVAAPPGTGPILGGVSPVPVTTGPGVVSPLPGSPPPISPLPGSSGGMPGIIGTPGMVLPPGLLPGGAVSPKGFVKPGSVGVPGSRSAMPSGGVIGATPGSGMVGQMPNKSGSASRFSAGGRANPVGGVIGQQGAMAPGINGRQAATGRTAGGTRSGEASGATRSTTGDMLSRTGRAGRKSEGRDEVSQWDPNNPWVTDEGVDPVLMPSPEPGPIDPGPAIGYQR